MVILDVFREINKTKNTTIVIVTHDRLLSKKVNRVAAIRDGKVLSAKKGSDFLTYYKLYHAEDCDRLYDVVVRQTEKRVRNVCGVCYG